MKKCMKIHVILFKNWKYIIKLLYQTRLNLKISQLLNKKNKAKKITLKLQLIIQVYSYNDLCFDS